MHQNDVSYHLTLHVAARRAAQPRGDWSIPMGATLIKLEQLMNFNACRYTIAPRMPSPTTKVNGDICGCAAVTDWAPDDDNAAYYRMPMLSLNGWWRTAALRHAALR